jgi:N-acetylmuramoyl-L-alanine amidase
MKVKKLIIHHSLTFDGKVVDWTAIRKYHIETNGWADIGYQYGIELVGDKYVVQKGRSEHTPGAHCLGQNDKSIGICVVGNYDLAEPANAALNLLAELCADICKRYGLTSNDIFPHNQFASYKTCPGKKFSMEKLKAKVKQLLGV